MSLADLIREKSRTHFATATPATLATHAGVKVRTVAKVATVTVATPPADLTVRCRDCAEFERPYPLGWWPRQVRTDGERATPCCKPWDWRLFS
jgi:hypothetical protein